MAVGGGAAFLLAVGTYYYAVKPLIDDHTERQHLIDERRKYIEMVGNYEVGAIQDHYADKGDLRNLLGDSFKFTASDGKERVVRLTGIFCGGDIINSPDSRRAYTLSHGMSYLKYQVGLAEDDRYVVSHTTLERHCEGPL